MSNIDLSLSEILDIDPIPPQGTPPVTDDVLCLPLISDTGNDIEDDLKFARQNIRHLITRGLASAEQLTSISQSSESPRAYEVMNALIKNLSEMNKDLLQLHKTAHQLKEPVKKDSSELPNTPQEINVKNAVFVGSTKDLAELVKKEKHASTDIPQ
mgnify:CR=1 FL=1